MNKKKLACVVLVAMVLLLGTALPGYARDGARFHRGFSGHRPFVGARVFIGPIWWGPRFRWGPPYPYYASPPVIVQQAPRVYIQQEPQPPQQAYWYYCPNPQGYYPYIQACPPGWMTVVPPSAPPGR